MIEIFSLLFFYFSLYIQTTVYLPSTPPNILPPLSPMILLAGAGWTLALAHNMHLTSRQQGQAHGEAREAPAGDSI